MYSRNPHCSHSFQRLCLLFPLPPSLPPPSLSNLTQTHATHYTHVLVTTPSTAHSAPCGCFIFCLSPPVNYYLHRTTRTTTRPSFVLSPPSAAKYTGKPDTLLKLCDSNSASKYKANGGDAKVVELIAAGINLRHQVRERKET